MPFLRALSVEAEPGPYPFHCATVLSLRGRTLPSPFTLLVGENGSGKSTLLEALAVKLRLPALGAADTAQDPTLAGLRPLADALHLTFTRKQSRGFFLRAEDSFGYTRRIEAMQRELRDDLVRVEEANKGRSRLAQEYARMAYASSLYELDKSHGDNPDARSHGEAFLHLFEQRIRPGGLYLLDEPETPLSPLRQLTLLTLLLERKKDSQFIIATHSPLLMALPGADIWSFDELPVRSVAYENLEQVRLTRDFLNRPEAYLRRLTAPDGEAPG